MKDFTLPTAPLTTTVLYVFYLVPTHFNWLWNHFKISSKLCRIYLQHL